MVNFVEKLLIMYQLQKTLQTNAIFSGISGMTLIFFHQRIAHLFEAKDNTVFWVVGLVLVFFASTILYEIRKQRSLAILWIITQDFLWVICSMLFLVFNPFLISQAGLIIIGIVALIVLYMGINQAIALGKIDCNPQKKGKQWGV